MIPGETRVADGEIELNAGRKRITAIKSPVLQKLKLERQVEAVNNIAHAQKNDMLHTNWQPKIEVDSETYEVRADGELLECEAARELPVARRYFLFDDRNYR